jgi:hypothetical protein
MQIEPARNSCEFANLADDRSVGVSNFKVLQHIRSDYWLSCKSYKSNNYKLSKFSYELWGEFNLAAKTRRSAGEN